MTRHIMAIDLDSCVGCHSCTIACKQENNIGLGTFYSKVLTIGPSGTYPDLEMYYLPVACQHCDNPQCVDVCPTGASYVREDGVVLVDHSKCIGCQYCVMACPYGVRSYDEQKDKGVIEKCTLCAHRIDEGLEPACVAHCPAHARIFGDIDDPESKISKYMEKFEGQHKLTDVGNKPGVTYLMDKCEWKGDRK